MTTGAKGWKNDDEKAFDAALGARIRRLREKAGVTQTELAALTGVSFQQMGKYEGGVDRIAVSRLAVMASALNVPVSLLIDGEPAALLKVRGDIRAAKLAALFERCGPEGQDILIHLAETLVRE